MPGLGGAVRQAGGLLEAGAGGAGVLPQAAGHTGPAAGGAGGAGAGGVRVGGALQPGLQHPPAAGQVQPPHRGASESGGGVGWGGAP